MQSYRKSGLKIFSICLSIVFVFSSLSFSPHPVIEQEVESVEVSPKASFAEQKMQVYDSLNLDQVGLSREAFYLGLQGMQKLVESGKARNNDLISIVDFSQPSTNRRLYVIDLNNYRLLFNTLVAHGRNSGMASANDFSNKVSSYKSSLGFYVTGGTYSGNHGYSLRLSGMEKGINDNAFARAIVMHAADYVNDAWIKSRGFIGRSHGCPAVPVAVHKPLISKIKDGSCVFVYHPSKKYLQQSPLLNS